MQRISLTPVEHAARVSNQPLTIHMPWRPCNTIRCWPRVQSVEHKGCLPASPACLDLCRLISHSLTHASQVSNPDSSGISVGASAEMARLNDLPPELFEYLVFILREYGNPLVFDQLRQLARLCLINRAFAHQVSLQNLFSALCFLFKIGKARALRQLVQVLRLAPEYTTYVKHLEIQRMDSGASPLDAVYVRSATNQIIDTFASWSMDPAIETLVMNGLFDSPTWFSERLSRHLRALALHTDHAILLSSFLCTAPGLVKLAISASHHGDAPL